MALARSLAGSLARPLASAITGAGGGASLPLDGVTSAVLAYSAARKLRTAYSGSAIRVRRSSDNAEQDIGFTAGNALDTATLLAFVGSNDGFIVTRYEQSGHPDAVDETQPTAARQPAIVTAGVLNTLNGNAAAIYDTSDRLPAATWATRPSAAEIVLVCQHPAAGTNFVCLGVETGSGYALAGTSGDATTVIEANIGTPSYAVDGTAFTPTTRDDVFNGIANGATRIVRVSSADLSSADWATIQSGVNNLTSFPGPQYGPELIVCTDATDADAVVTNSAAFWGVTLP